MVQSGAGFCYGLFETGNTSGTRTEERTVDDRFSEDELQGFIKDVVDIAERAGVVAMEHYDDVELDVEYKEDQSPLTRADLASNEVIDERLSELEPVLPILSEESEQDEWEERSTWDAFWMVDPLDGTKEFLKKNGEFTVNIALVQQGRPALGVVRAPALGVTYFAAEGMGAFRKEEGEVEVISVAESAPETVTVVVSRSHINAPTQAYVDRLEEDFEVETMPTGSSLKICMVAEDSAQVYPRLGPTMEWDTAAADCVVRQAGGSVDKADGAPLGYNKKDLLNPYFVAYALPEFVPGDWGDFAD